MANGFLNSLTGMMGIEDNIVKLISDFVYKIYHVIVTSKSQNVFQITKCAGCSSSQLFSVPVWNCCNCTGQLFYRKSPLHLAFVDIVTSFAINLRTHLCKPALLTTHSFHQISELQYLEVD